jgi:hypothetical protein
MLIATRRPELLSLVGYRPGLLYNPSRVYQSYNIGYIPCLLVGNRRSRLLLVPRLLLVSLLCLERSGSAQKPPANANSYLTVRCYSQLLSNPNPALTLQRFPQPLYHPLLAARVG